MSAIVIVAFGQPGRGSFNEAAERAQARLHDKGVPAVLTWVAERDPGRRAERLREIAGERPSLIVAHGGQGDGPVALAAADFPALPFVITQGHFLAPNVANYEVLQEQSAFLAGVLSAARYEPERIAHLSGDPVRPGLAGRAAFAQGVRLQSGQPLRHTGFNGNQHDVELAVRNTRYFADRGVQVLFTMMDGGREGVDAVCRERGLRQIANVRNWVDTDPQLYWASAVADSAWAIEQAVLDFVQGRLALGQRIQTGLENPDVVRLATGPDLNAAERAVLDDWSQRLLAGELVLETRFEGEESPFSVVSQA